MEPSHHLCARVKFVGVCVGVGVCGGGKGMEIQELRGRRVYSWDSRDSGNRDTIRNVA